MGGRALGFDIRPVMVRGAKDYAAAFSSMVTECIDAVIVQSTLPRKDAVDLTLKHRLPSGSRAFTERGGLMSYSASVADRYRNAAIYVHKILRAQDSKGHQACVAAVIPSPPFPLDARS
jgi:hypothetical protein